MRPHAIGHGLDEGGSLAGVGPGEGEAGRGQDGQHVVAVDLDPGDAVALAALGDGGVGLEAHRLGDRPLVVLAEEDDRDREAGREAERLGDVALAAGPVAEVGRRRPTAAPSSVTPSA